MPLPERVRVQEHTGRHTVLEHPRLESDSVLVGLDADKSDVTRIPVRDIVALEERAASFGRTVLLLGVSGLLLAFAILVATVPDT